MSLSISAAHDIYQLSDDESDVEMSSSSRPSIQKLTSTSTSTSSHPYSPLSHSHVPAGHLHEADVNEYDMISHQHDEMEHKYDQDEDEDEKHQQDEKEENNDDDIIEITRITSEDESSESSIGSPINSAVLGLDIDMPVLPLSAVASTTTSSNKRKRESTTTTPKKKSTSRYFHPPDVTFKCFNCGDVGHLSRDCDKEKLLKPCYLCGHRDHYSQSCPHELCWRCLLPGHQSRDCTYEKVLIRICMRCGGDHFTQECTFTSSTSISILKSTRCYVCGHMGHLCCSTTISTYLPDASDAEAKTISVSTSVKPSSSRSTVYCGNCSQKGHTITTCTAPKLDVNINDNTTGGRERNDRCHICNAVGHFARTCPQERARIEKERMDATQCFKCQKYGHMAADCPNPPMRRASSYDNRERRHYQGRDERRDDRRSSSHKHDDRRSRSHKEDRRTNSHKDDRRRSSSHIKHDDRRSSSSSSSSSFSSSNKHSHSNSNSNGNSNKRDPQEEWESRTRQRSTHYATNRSHRTDPRKTCTY